MAKLFKHYISVLDQFLIRFRHAQPESESQRVEREKHERIAELRDNPVQADGHKLPWEGF